MKLLEYESPRRTTVSSGVAINASISQRAARVTKGARCFFRQNPVAFVFAILITLQLGVATVSIYTLSAVRAYVTAESLYSKGQKDAFLNLQDYLRTHDDGDYQQFLANIDVPTGDERARLAMQQEVPDLQAARQGVLEAKNQPSDVDSMIWLFSWGQHVPFMAKAIAVWTEADGCIDELRLMVARARTQIMAGRYESPEEMEIRALTPALNKRLTQLQIKFSDQLGEAARTLQALLLAVNLSVAVFLIAAGGRYMFRTTRIQRQNEMEIRELVDAVGDAILACDDGHQLVIFNRAAERMFGCDAKAAQGQPMSRFLRGPLGCILSPFAHQESGDNVQRVKAVRFNGAPIQLEASVSHITTGNGVLTILTCRDVTEKDAAQEQERNASASRNLELHHMAHIDGLTGLPNKAALELALERLFAMTSSGRPFQFAVLFLDLDGFKAVNDSLGHIAGDELLQHVARRLKHATRVEDEVFRLSGDEFVIVARCDEDSHVVEVLSKRILASVRESYLLDGDALARVTVSVGVANFPKDGLDARTLLVAADAAMYRAKRGGKDSYRTIQTTSHR